MRTPATTPPLADPASPPPRVETYDRLKRADVDRRAEATPYLKKAELLGGIVHMGSPVSSERHGEPHAMVIFWLGYFQIATPGVRVADNTTVRLGPEDEPQPDA